MENISNENILNFLRLNNIDLGSVASLAIRSYNRNDGVVCNDAPLTKDDPEHLSQDARKRDQDKAHFDKITKTLDLNKSQYEKRCAQEKLAKDMWVRASDEQYYAGFEIVDPYLPKKSSNAIKSKKRRDRRKEEFKMRAEQWVKEFNSQGDRF